MNICLCCCHSVIYKIHVFGLWTISGTELLGISSVMRTIKLSSVMLTRWLLDLTWGWGLDARRADPGIRGLALSVASPPLGRREGLEAEAIANGQWFNQLCQCNDAAIKIQKDEVGELLVSAGVEVLCWESGVPRGHGGSAPFQTYLALCISFFWMFLSLYLSVINWQSNK